MPNDILDLSKQGLKEISSDHYHQLSDAVVLDLGSNPLSRLPDDTNFWISLYNIRKLCVGSCHSLTSLPSGLASLTTLQILHAEDDAISSVPPLPPSLVHLNVSRNRITELPPESLSLTLLTKLLISNNSIRILPPEISFLSSLEILDASYNHLVVVPDTLTEISSLKYINFSHNAISSLPDDMDHLHSLEVLDLSDNKLQVLPASLSELSKLTIFHVQGNEIVRHVPACAKLLDVKCSGNILRALPDGIENMVSLQRLEANCNCIGIIPAEIGRLHDLLHLNLRSNKLICMPSEIGCLTSLVVLDLAHNSLTDLPTQLCLCKQLRTLDVSSNFLYSLPISMHSLANLRALDTSYNRIHALPESLSALETLESLNTSHNQVEDISESFCLGLTQLSKLDLSHNQIDSLPLELNVMFNRGTNINVDKNPLRQTFALQRPRYYSQTTDDGHTKYVLCLLQHESALYNALLSSAGWNAVSSEHNLVGVSLEEFTRRTEAMIRNTCCTGTACISLETRQSFMSCFYTILRDEGSVPDFCSLKRRVLKKRDLDRAQSNECHLSRAQKARDDEKVEALRVNNVYYSNLDRRMAECDHRHQLFEARSNDKEAAEMTKLLSDVRMSTKVADERNRQKIEQETKEKRLDILTLIEKAKMQRESTKRTLPIESTPCWMDSAT